MSQRFYFDIWPPDDYVGSALGELTEAANRQVREADQSIGEGQFEINRHSPQAVWCEPRALVRVRLSTGGPFAYDDPRYVAAFFIETSDDVALSEDEQGGETLTRGGPSVVSILKRAINYPNANISGHASYWTSAKITGDIIIKNKTVGEAFRILILNAMDRAGNLPGVTIDFTISDDSSGTPWPDTDTDWRFPVGMTILEALSKLVSSKSYYRMKPSLLLSVYEDHPGADLSGSVTFSKGVSVVETSSKTIDASNFMSRALVRGQKSANQLTYLQVFDTGVEAETGRVEGYVEFQTTPTTARLTKAGQQAIDKSKLQQDGPVTAKVLDESLTPFVDYEPGDIVTVDIPDVYDSAEVRIAAISLVEIDSGEYDVIHEYQAVPFDPASGPDNFASATGGPGGTANCGDCPDTPPFVPDVSGSAALYAVLYGPNNRPDRAFYPYVGWYGDGDAPPTGYAAAAKTGAVEYVDRTVNGLTQRWALRVLADATVDIHAVASMAEVFRPGSWTTTFRLLVNNSVLHAQTTGESYPDLAYFADSYDHTETGVALHAGDVVSLQAFWSYGGVPVLVPAGTDGGQLELDGTAGAVVAANEPIQGQWVGEEVIVAEGDTTYATNYAYSENSLHVYAEGVHIVVGQTDPEAGTFALADELPAGTHLFLWYQATTGDYLGTGNPPAPGPRNGVIPYPLLGDGGDGSGDHVLYDDGIWRSPADVGGGSGSDCCNDDPIDRATLRTEVYYAAAPAVVQSKTNRADSGVLTVTLDSTPIEGNLLEVWLWSRSSTVHSIPPSGFTLIDEFNAAPFYCWHGYKVAGPSESTSISTSGSLVGGMRMVVVELSGVDVASGVAKSVLGAGTYGADHSISPTGSGFVDGIFLANTDIPGRETHISSPSTIIEEGAVDAPGNGPYGSVGYRDVAPLTAHSGNTAFQDVAYIVDNHDPSNTPSWIDAPDASDADDSSFSQSDDRDPDDAFLRANLGSSLKIGGSRLLIGFSSSGSRTLELYGANEDDFSDEELLATETFTATGSYTGDEVITDLHLPAAWQYYRWKESTDHNRRVYTWELTDATLEDLHEHSLDSLSDVDTTGAITGDVLTYDGSIWGPAAPTGSGGSDDPVADIFGTPDTAFEFETNSATGLTLLSPTADVIDLDTTVPGHLYIKDNASGTARCGYYASAPSMPFTAITKISGDNVRSDYHQVGLFVGQSTPGTMKYIMHSRANRGVETETGTPTGFTGAITTTPVTDVESPLWLAIVCNSSSDYDFLWSTNGYIWAYLTEAHNASLTPGSVGLFFAANNTNGAGAAFDFLRIWNSAKSFPGVY